MNDNDLEFKSTPPQRTYTRRYRTKSRLTTIPLLPFTTTTTITTILTTNQTLLINSPSVAVDDLAAGFSYFVRHKPIFLIALSLLIFLCLISTIFLIGLYKCSKRGSWKSRRQQRLDKKRLKHLPDFLDDQHDYKGENDILLEQNGTINSQRTVSITTNGLLPNDNTSNTFSLDPMLEQKINRNNPPNTLVLSPMADDTSIDTLRGSLISSPSQQISASQVPLTPTTATDSMVVHPDERAVEAERDDDLHDLDLPRIQQRFTKANNNNSSSNVAAHRTSSSSIEQSIRRQERRAEEEERGLLHGSNSNLYEKEMMKRAEQESFARKQHTNSQVSLVSRTSEDSCY